MVICTGIKLIEHLNTTSDLLEVSFNDGKSAYFISEYGECLKFIDQEVIVDFREDIYKGQLVPFINTFTVPTKVNVLDRHDNMKLYVDQTDNFATVNFRDMQEGEHIMGATLYCISSQYDSSPNAVWLALKVRDKAMRIMTMRLFDYDNASADFGGKYIKADIRKTKYGLVTTKILPKESSAQLNPEVTIARQYIHNVFKDAVDIQDIISKYNLVDAITNVVDIEEGYLTVRIAQELDLIESMSNITNAVDLELIKRYALLSRIWAAKPASDYSHEMTAIVALSRESFDKKKEVMLMIDKSDIVTKELEVYQRIKDLVDITVHVRKDAYD